MSQTLHKQSTASALQLTALYRSLSLSLAFVLTLGILGALDRLAQPASERGLLAGEGLATAVVQATGAASAELG